MNKLPLLIFILLIGLFAIPLLQGKDPTVINSALIGKSVPTFSLPSITPHQKAFTNKNLLGEVSLLNVFASWCVSCHLEQPILEKIAKAEQINIYAINYKDKPDAARAWLQKYGNPFTAVGDDRQGFVAIDFGVYGVPETFLINRQGIIVYKHVGPLTAKTYQEVLKPMIASLR